MLVWLLPLALLVPAAWIDLRTHEVPDLIPLGLLVWLLVCWALGWTPGSSVAVGLGVLAALLPAVLLWRLGGLGGGDVKLLAPLGGLAGWPQVLTLLGGTALAGGLLAVVLLLRGAAAARHEPAQEPASGELARADAASPELAYVPAITLGWASLCALRWEALA